MGRIRTVFLFSLLLAARIAQGQVDVKTQLNQASTPLVLAPGTPAGSYRLNAFESINLYNGKVNVAIPLLDIGGRGATAFTLTVPIQSYSWSVQVDTTGSICSEGCIDYVHTSGAIWSAGDSLYRPWYGPGMLIAKYSGIDPSACNGGGQIFMRRTFTHVSFLAPDGTEHELFPSDGRGDAVNACNSYPSWPRGPLFRSYGDSNLWFLNNIALNDRVSPDDYASGPVYNPNDVNGTLYFPDGRQYHVVNGLVTAIVDRNGNRTSFSYASRQVPGQPILGSVFVNSIIDAAGRTYAIDYLVTDETGCSGNVQCDRIRYSGESNIPQKIVVKYLPLQFALRGDYSFSTRRFLQLSTEQDIGAEPVLSEIDLPNGTSWKLFYNPYAEISKVVLPTGGAIEYDHGAGLSNAGQIGGAYASGQVLDDLNGINTGSVPNAPWRPFIYRRIEQRREYNSVIPSEGSQKRTEAAWKTSVYRRFESAGQPYTYPNTSAVADFVLASTGVVSVTHTGANGATAISEGHKYHDRTTINGATFGGSLDAASPGSTIKFGAQTAADFLATFPDGFQGKDYHVETGGGGGSAVRIVDRAYGLEQQGATAKECQENVTTIEGGAAITSTKVFLYDRSLAGGPQSVSTLLGFAGIYSFGNLTDVYEYGFDSPLTLNEIIGAGPSGRYCPTSTSGWSQRTHTDYHQGSQYFTTAQYLPSLTTQERVYDAVGQLTDISNLYDTPGTIAEFYSYVSNATQCGGGASATRGNLSSIIRSVYDLRTRMLLGTVSESFSYDCVGNLRRYVDPKSIATTFSYADSWIGCSSAGPTYAYLTQINLANNAVLRRSYDFCTGHLRQETDPNGLATGFSFADGLNRLRSTTRAGDARIQENTMFSYSDVPQPGSVVTNIQSSKGQYSAADARLNSKIGYDAFGRQVLVETSGAATIQTTTVYDGYGRTYQKCNLQELGFSNPSDGCTTFTYEALGRATRIQAADGSATQMEYGAQTSTPKMRLLTVTDPAGVQQKLYYDALDRLKQVTEVGRNYQTSYTYGGLDNLTDVSQTDLASGITQTRHFEYDSLGRLLLAQNPETGTIRYSYDANGNLSSKTDGRYTTCYGFWTGASCDATGANDGYDSLNRVIRITYSGNGAPEARYCYDGRTYSNGSCTSSPVAGQMMRKTGSGNSVASTSYSYDQAGRLTGSAQNMGGGAPYTFSYQYYNDDRLGSITYPSGTTVVTCYDANGRVAWVSKNRSLSDCPSGGAGSSPYVTVQSFWPHGAIKQATMGNGVVETSGFNNRLQMSSMAASKSGVTRISLGFNYCAYPQTGCAANNGNLRWQQIAYPANGTETAFDVIQQYEYDAVNRLTSFSEAGKVQTYDHDAWGNHWLVWNPGGFAVSNLTPTSSSWFRPAGNVAPTNRILWVAHDGSGNQTQFDPFTLSYDAENRLKTVSSALNGSASYDYDAEGRRVRRTTAATTTLVYDGFGNLAAEYGTGDWLGTQYLTADHLGSTRLVTDAEGNVMARYDYIPFGEGVRPADLNGRSARYSIGAYPDTGDGLNIKFTGQYRDAETGLDFFEARYFSGAQGRFTSPDPEGAGATAHDPQSWNMYAYARNNPLRYTDPTGMNYTVCDTQNHCRDVSDDEYNKWREAQGKNIIVTASGNILDRETEKKIGSAQYYDEKPLEALKEAGNRAARDTSTFMISSAGFATAYLGTYAIPAAIAAVGAAASSGPGVAVIIRAQQLAHAMRSEPGHNTPLGTAEEIKTAVTAAVKAGSYSVSAGGVVKGTAYIQGVAHEFTGFMRTAGEMVFSNIYRK